MVALGKQGVDKKGAGGATVLFSQPHRPSLHFLFLLSLPDYHRILLHPPVNRGCWTFSHHTAHYRLWIYHFCTHGKGHE